MAAGLTLTPIGQPSPDIFADADDEESTHRHYVWSDISSEGRGSSTELSHHPSGSERGSSGNEKRKKLQNKRLARSDDHRPPSGDTSSLGSQASNCGSRTSPSAGPLKNIMSGNVEHVLFGTSSGTEAQQESLDGSGREDQAAPAPFAQKELSHAELEGLEATVRRDEKGKPTSIGSENHGTICKACLFVFTSVGCDSGVACPFCHFKHNRKDRPKPCKSKRHRYRKMVEEKEMKEMNEQILVK